MISASPADPQVVVGAVAVRPEDTAMKAEEDPVPTEHETSKLLLPRGQARARPPQWTRMDGQLCRTKRDVRDARWRKRGETTRKEH